MEKQKKKFKHSSTFYRKRLKLCEQFKKDVKHRDFKRLQKCNTLELSSEDVDLETPIQASSSGTSTNFPELPKFCDVETEDIDTELLHDNEEIFTKDQDKVLMFIENLRGWALRNRITHVALNELLYLLSHAGFNNLPKDCRTLLQTPQKVEIVPMGTGHFWYYGIKHNLTNILLNNEGIIKPVNVAINFHVDGMPINNSSKTQFWPILMKIVEFSNVAPQVVAIYCGESKPPAKLFFEEFVTELNNLLDQGMQINEFQIKIKINAFICDTPARAFSKCIVSHNAYSSCNKCTVRGQYCQSRRMSFPQIDCPPRTNEAFRQKIDNDHHITDVDTEVPIPSPLESLPIDMIKDFPIADSLHLVDFGIMKRCLKGWVHGNHNFRVKLFPTQIEIISKWLEKSNSKLPKDIHRSARGLKCLSFWKGTEYRTFLLYLGPVILKDHLTNELYRHFLLFFCAITICSTNYYTKNEKLISLAEQLLKDYIELFIANYGDDAISSNVHNLCHLIDDVRRFGPLPLISSYPFESKLGSLKQLIRSGNRPLAQVAKRLIETSVLDCTTPSTPETPVLKNEIINPHFVLPASNISYFKTIKLVQGVELSADPKNQWFMTKNGDIVKMICVYLLKNTIYIYGSKLKKLLNFFDYPFESKYLNIYMASSNFHEACNFEIEHIKCKVVGLDYITSKPQELLESEGKASNYNDMFVFFPLLHTIDLLNM